MRRKKILLMLALLCAIVQGAWADEVTTVLDDGVFTGFTATAGSNTGDGGYDKLVDGSTGTKWCTNSSPFYIEFHSSGLIVPTGYIMTTAGDTQSYSGRNPKSWTIQAKANEGDSWTTLVTVTDDATMPAANYTPVEFAISGNTTAYKYFRLDVSAIQSGSWFQLSEFQFKGTTTDTGNFTVIASLNGSGTAESPYTISSTDDWNWFVDKVNGGNSYSGKYVRLTQNINVSTVVGYRNSDTDGKPFSGTFLGDGHTITAALTADGKSGLAPFRYISGATIQNLTIGGTIASASYHTGGLVGFADGTNLIENCTVTATLNVSSDYAGGIIGHGLSSSTTIQGCVFAGTINGVDGNRSNIGGIWGWSDSATPTLVNCLEKGTYTNIASMHPMGLQSNNGTITNCYYLNPQVGSPSRVCTVSGAVQVYTAAPADGIYTQMTAADNNTYYAVCTVSGVYDCAYTGSVISVTPTVTCGSTTLTADDDYTCTFSPATVQEVGDYTLTITGKGSYQGHKTVQFSVLDGNPVTASTTTMTDGVYVVSQDVTITSRITISGTVTLRLGEGITLYAPKGIELSANNNANLTIEGSGALTINGCDVEKAGIGSGKVGILTINGGIINVNGGANAAGIGGDQSNISGGTITINGGWVKATGGVNAAGIGGGRNYWEKGACGVCGDVIFNGGQVTAIGLNGAQGIGVGQIYHNYTTYQTGTLTINWTSLDDFIYSNNFNKVSNTCSLEKITIASGKKFVIEGSETVVDETTDDLFSKLSGKKIWGYNSAPIMLTDASTYKRGANLSVTSATYTKTLGEERVGKRQAWLVPFDYTITADDAEKFTFYKINMIANSPDPSQDATDDIWMYVKKMEAGDVLHANMPYVYKPKEAVTDYVFSSENAVLKAVTSDPVATMQTMEDTYSIYGTYEPTRATAADPFYYMTVNGHLALGNDGTVTVGAFRWIMRVESKTGQASQPAYAPRRIFIYDGESETTGIRSLTPDPSPKGEGSEYWYTLDGRKLQGQPSRAGVYINNGNKIVIRQ